MSGVPFDIQDISSELNKELLADFHGERTGFVQIGVKKYLLPVKYRLHAEDIYNFSLRPEDVWVITYPRSGTTVMQEMVWLLIHDLNYEEAASLPLTTRSPFIEFGVLVHDGLIADIIELIQGDSAKIEEAKSYGRSQVQVLNSTPSPRCIKSHLPLSLLPPKLIDTSKLVYIARNPKDMAVSFYHHNRLLTTQGYVGDFSKYWGYFQRDLLPWCPYWEHLKEAWLQRNHKNMLFLFYEDMIKDMKGTIVKVSSHLGKQLNEGQIQKLANHLHIDNFRKNPSTNLDTETESDIPGLVVKGEEDFIRKGKSGGWRSYFSPGLNSKADKWISENLKKIPGFSFPDINL